MENQKENKIKIFCPENWVDYKLSDTGEGEKLERFGPYVFIRPYEDAVWKKTLGEGEWAKADGKFWSSREGAKSGWKMKNKDEQGLPLLKEWKMQYKGVKFLVSPTPFRHLGFFPEQASHWEFIEETIRDAGKKISTKGGPASGWKFLNLFGYTGVASLFALRAGAEVTHVDASKQTLDWVKKNQELNANIGLDKMPLRVILDDALKFLEREIKRGNKYDAVVMDPPKFGRGPKGETWKIEKDLSKLLASVRKILSDKPLFVILTSYAVDFSSLSLGYALEEAMKDFKGETKQGELCLKEKSKDRFIPLASTATWHPL